MRHCVKCLFLSLSIICCSSYADDPQTLKAEALEILKANSVKTVSPEEYATCLFKLEKAQSMLEAAGESNSPLAQEVSSALFWARKFSTAPIVTALEQMKKSSGAATAIAVPKKIAPPKAPATATANKIEPPELIAAREAKVAYDAAEAYSSSHTGDDYLISLRFFQMASEHAGTEYALKALERARALQTSIATKSAAAESLPNGPEMELVKVGDQYVTEKKFEQAFETYKKSLAIKETVIAHRHLATASFKYAQEKQDELKPKFEAHYAKYTNVYKGAWRTTNFGRVFDTRDPGLVGWQRELDELRKESDVAQRNYQNAEQDFKAILRLSPEQKDFEAAGYLGLCQSVRPMLKMQGRQSLEAFVKSYTPSTDAERALYEFCKTEITRLKG